MLKNTALNDDVETYLAEFTRITVGEIGKLIYEQVGMVGQEYAQTLPLSVLSGMIATMLEAKLSAISKQTQDSDEAARRYQLFKLEIQNAVSVGFETAFTQFAGKSYDYVTEIRPMPEPANKELC